MSRELSLGGRLHLPAGLTAAAGVIAAFACVLYVVQRFGLPIWSIAVLIVAVVYGLVVVQRPVVGLFAVVSVFFLPIQIGGGVTLLQAVGAGTTGLILLSFLSKRRALVFDPVLIPLCLLGVLILVSFFYTRDAERTARFFRLWAFNMMFAWLLVNMVTDGKTLKRVLWAIVLMAAVNSVSGVLEFATASAARFRSEGLLENANEFGNLAALAFPLALYQYLYRRGSAKWLGLVLAGLCLGGVIASVSRGALISLLTVFGLMLLVERRRATALLLVAVLALAALPFVPSYFFERVDTLATDVKGTVYFGESENITIRGHYNRGGLKIFLAHPILGVGIGNFGFYFVDPEFNPGARASELVPAHNIYLQALVEMGVIGFGVLLWLIGLTIRNVIRARASSRDDPDLWPYLGGIEMMAFTVLIASFSTGNLVSEGFWLLLCLAAAAARVAGSSREAQESSSAPVAPAEA
jgi:O-antigen ligase